LLKGLDSFVDVASTAVGRPDRHRSVRATVEWSLSLITESERMLFRRLSVFSGPAPLELVSDVCGEGIVPIDALGVLLDHALVQRGATGFTLVAAARDVAADHLQSSGELDRVRRDHAAALCVLGERVRGYDVKPDDKAAAAGLHADVWSALAWSRSSDPRLHRGLLYGFAPELALSGQLRRTQEELDAALARDHLDAIDEGELLRLRAYLLVLLREGEAALRDAERAVLLAGAGPSEASGRALITGSQAHAAEGHFDAARAVAEQGVACFRAIGDGILLTRGLVELAQTSLQTGDTEAAGAALDEAEFLAAGAPDLESMVAAYRADWALAIGDFSEAIAVNARRLEEDDPDSAPWSVAAMAVACAGLERAEAALELGAIAEMMAKDLGTPIDGLVQAGHTLREMTATARQMLAVSLAHAAEQAGRAVPAGQRMARAREIGLAVLRAGA
jgi:tetratricopeptide (TPR) repeat protein